MMKSYWVSTSQNKVLFSMIRCTLKNRQSYGRRTSGVPPVILDSWAGCPCYCVRLRKPGVLDGGGFPSPGRTCYNRRWIRKNASMPSVSCRKGQAVKSYRRELCFNTKQRREFINITPQVETCLRESGINDGPVWGNDRH